MVQAAVVTADENNVMVDGTFVAPNRTKAKDGV